MPELDSAELGRRPLSHICNTRREKLGDVEKLRIYNDLCRSPRSDPASTESARRYIIHAGEVCGFGGAGVLRWS